MTSSLNKKETVLITGSTSGIGWQLAKVFAENGHDLILTGRDPVKLEEIVKITRDLGVISNSFICDLRNPEEIKNLSEFAIEKKVTTLINNAGLPCPSKSLGDLELEEMSDVLALNLYAPILLTKFLYDHFLTLSSANIIALNSMVGREVKKCRTVYSASKWGLRGFFNSLHEEAKEKNINVLSIYPTNVKTRPNQQNSMDVEYVVENIYTAFLEQKSELIIDGRNMTVSAT